MNVQQTVQHVQSMSWEYAVASVAVTVCGALASYLLVRWFKRRHNERQAWRNFQREQARRLARRTTRDLDGKW